MSKGDHERTKRPIQAKLYVGNLGDHPPKKEDLEYEFGYFGPLLNIWIARSPPGFAYIEFETEKDARDAQRALDGKTVNDRRIKVEHARRPQGRPRRRSVDRFPKHNNNNTSNKHDKHDNHDKDQEARSTAARKSCSREEQINDIHDTNHSNLPTPKQETTAYDLHYPYDEHDNYYTSRFPDRSRSRSDEKRLKNLGYNNLKAEYNEYRSRSRSREYRRSRSSSTS